MFVTSFAGRQTNNTFHIYLKHRWNYRHLTKRKKTGLKKKKKKMVRREKFTILIFILIVKP